MSGLVFVRDAQGRPLMPTSAANARILLRQRKARHEAHPVFTVIRLTQVIAAPVVRPVLLIMVLHRRTTTLFVVIDNARVPTTSLSILVDPSLVHNHSNPHHWRGRRSMLRRRSLHVTPPLFGVPASLSGVIARRYMQALLQVVTLLQSLLPVSHVACMFPPFEVNHLHDYRRPMEYMLIRSLAVYGLHVTMINRELNQPTALSPALGRALLDVATGRTILAPQVVASFPAHQMYRPQLGQSPVYFNRRQSHGKYVRDRPDKNNTVREHLCTVRLEKRTIIGIVRTSSSNRQLIIRLVRRANSDGVTWQWIRVSASVPRQVWPPYPVLLLPIIDIEQS